MRMDMAAGRLIKEGFLGEDDRPLTDIISEDLDALAGLGVSQVELARAMRALTRRGMEGMGENGGHRGLSGDHGGVHGLAGLPFKDGRRAAKRNTLVQDKASGKQMRWTDLSIHLIETHAFFQGKGSAFRLEPAELAAFLKLPAKGDQTP